MGTPFTQREGRVHEEQLQARQCQERQKAKARRMAGEDVNTVVNIQNIRDFAKDLRVRKAKEKGRFLRKVGSSTLFQSQDRNLHQATGIRLLTCFGLGHRCCFFPVYPCARYLCGCPLWLHGAPPLDGDTGALRSFRLHEQQSIAMTVATALHHSMNLTSLPRTGVVEEKRRTSVTEFFLTMTTPLTAPRSRLTFPCRSWKTSSWSRLWTRCPYLRSEQIGDIPVLQIGTSFFGRVFNDPLWSKSSTFSGRRSRSTVLSLFLDGAPSSACQCHRQENLRGVSVSASGVH